MNYRILIVDDEADILEFIRYNLKKEGYEVYTASDGLEALKVAAEVSPHLVLLDVMMPNMDGMETCRQLRKMPQTEDAVIAFLTARSEDYSQVAGFDAGADDYIAKPVALCGAQKRRGDRTAPQNVRTARPAVLQTAESLPS